MFSCNKISMVERTKKKTCEDVKLDIPSDKTQTKHKRQHITHVTITHSIRRRRNAQCQTMKVPDVMLILAIQTLCCVGERQPYLGTGEWIKFAGDHDHDHDHDHADRDTTPIVSSSSVTSSSTTLETIIGVSGDARNKWTAISW